MWGPPSNSASRPLVTRPEDSAGISLVLGKYSSQPVAAPGILGETTWAQSPSQFLFGFRNLEERNGTALQILRLTIGERASLEPN